MKNCHVFLDILATMNKNRFLIIFIIQKNLSGGIDSLHDKQTRINIFVNVVNITYIIAYNLLKTTIV